MGTHTSTTRAGFSLIEIMIALLIIGLIMGGAAIAFRNQFEKAKRKTTVTSLKVLKNAIFMYEADIGRLPATLRDLVKRPRDEKASKKWESAYIQGAEVPTDGYGKKFIYKPESDGKNPYQLYSYGPNGKGAPKSEWISVWDK